MVRVHALFQHRALSRFSARWRTLIRYLYYILYPFHWYGSKHFSNYVQLLHLHKNIPFRKQWIMIIVNGLLVYHVAHLLFVSWIYTPIEGSFANFINGDIISLIVPTASMRRVNISFTLLVIYINKYLIYDQNIYVLNILERILDNDSSFLIGDSKVKQYNMKVVQKFFYLLLNICNVLILAVDMILIYICLYYSYQFWTLKRFLTLWGPFLLILQLLNLSSGFTMLYLYGHQFTLIMSSSMSMALVFMLNFKQNQRKLEHWVTSQTLTPGRFELFHIRFETNLRYFFECNQVYGKVFFLVLMVNIPASANIIIQLITSVLSDYVKFTLYFVCFNQFFLIFLIHYYLTKPIKRIHDCYRVLYTFLSSYCVKSDRFDCRTMSKITSFMFMIHTNNYYGFTYANITLISMPTFFKVSFRAVRTNYPSTNVHCLFLPLQYSVIYSKFAMVAFKLRYDMY